MCKNVAWLQLWDFSSCLCNFRTEIRKLKITGRVTTPESPRRKNELPLSRKLWSKTTLLLTSSVRVFWSVCYGIAIKTMRMKKKGKQRVLHELSPGRMKDLRLLCSICSSWREGTGQLNDRLLLLCGYTALGITTYDNHRRSGFSCPVKVIKSFVVQLKAKKKEKEIGFDLFLLVSNR